MHTEETGLTVYTVDTEVQQKFFAEVNKELQKVEGFFRGEYVIHGYIILYSIYIDEDVNNYIVV